jgi:hypothetical protein
MSVRCIKKIFVYGERIKIPFPLSIKNAFTVYKDEIFVCKFKRHFDSNKNLIYEINETESIKGFYDHASPDLYHNRFDLKASSIAKKYGFCEGEYIEVFFQKIERTREKEEKGIFAMKRKMETETIPIFPDRMVEDLDFTP